MGKVRDEATCWACGHINSSVSWRICDSCDTPKDQSDTVYRRFVLKGDQYCEDPIVNSVINKFKSRSDEGMKKYGKTMEDNPLPTLEWITHAQEEAMDFILYLERLKKDFTQ